MAKIPGFENHLHHRSIDVSSLQETLEMFGMPRRPKVEVHRALADIEQDSLPLFDYCRDWIEQQRAEGVLDALNNGF